MKVGRAGVVEAEGGEYFTNRRATGNNLSALEAGKKPSVRADTVVRLAESLGCSADYLLALTDDPHPRPRRRREKAPAADGEEEAAA